MKKICGKPFNINKRIIAKACYRFCPFSFNEVFICRKKPFFLLGKKVIVTDDIETVCNNDIISISEDGNCTVLWEYNSVHNVLYLTDICNSKCIMCPQPMPEKPMDYYEDCVDILKLVNLKNFEQIGISGGEPTINIDRLKNILQIIKKKNPKIAIHVLTNGRLFKDMDKLQTLIKVQNSDITFGIPLYSNIAEEHDYIVGVKGAFEETIKGLYNLAKLRQKVEIRIVILKQNYKKLKDIAEFIYRNLPFAVHIAFMSMEYTGSARCNFEEVFIDPLEYKNELFLAAQELNRYNMNFSIYNTPLCLLDERLWDFARDSISNWKKSYTEKCHNCSQKEYCCGVFETSFTQSENIKAISC